MSEKNKKKGNFNNKKAAVLEEKKQNGSKGKVIGISVAILFLALVGMVLFNGGSGIKEVKAEGGLVKLPLPEISDGKAHYYTYDGSRGNINFFVLKSSDGVLRAAFDACDVCYRAKKGYRQEGDYMVCNNCGQRFASVNVNVLKGGCNPAPLDREVLGGELVFKVPDIESGRKYF